jgi:hypothetical protein
LEDVLDPFLAEYESNAIELLTGLQRILQDPWSEGQQVPPHPLAWSYVFGDFVVRVVIVEQFHTINVVRISAAS